MCNRSIPLIADMSCRSRLATLNEKLTTLERRVEYIEARVSISQEPLNFTPKLLMKKCFWGYIFSNEWSKKLFIFIFLYRLLKEKRCLSSTILLFE